MPEPLLRASSPGTSKQVKASKATTSLKTPELEDLRNSFIIRPTLASTTTHPSTSSPPKTLPSTPNPTVANSEQRDLRVRLGGRNVNEARKFYDNLGTNSWYRYMHGDRVAWKPINDLASLVCYG